MVMDVAIEVVLPKIGFTMNEAVLAEWLLPDGCDVSEGQPLYVMESNKASEEIPSPGAGRLRILKEAGETYSVGTVLAELV